MPYLLDTDSRTACLVVSINHLPARDGLKGLTMRQIAKVSGVSTSSMLRHFESRDHLLRLGALCEPDQPMGTDLARTLLSQHVGQLMGVDVTPRRASGSTG